MKQITIFFATVLCACLSISTNAQDGNDLNQVYRDEFGIKFEKCDISVEGNIREVVVDPANGRAYLSVQVTKGRKLKREGFVNCVDLKDGTVLWKKEFKYNNSNEEVNLELSPQGVPFVVMKYNAFGFEPETGEQKWTSYSGDFRIHPNGKCFLANDVMKEMTLTSTETGSLIWRRKLDFQDTQGANFTSDSCMVVLEKGVHHVNLVNGNAWYRKMKGLKSYNPMSQGGRAGVVAGSAVLFGLVGGLVAAAATSSSSTYMVGSKASNYLFEDDAIYVAAEYLAKYSHNNTLLWKDEDLSKKRGVSAIISLNEDDFLLVDFGYHYTTDGMKVRSGDGSCEFISKKTGDLHRGIMLRTEGDDYIKDFVLEDKTISFLGKRSLFTISLETLETLSTNEFGGAYANIGLSKFVDPNDYKRIDEKFVQLSSITDGSLLIRNTGKKVVEFDENLELVKVYSANEFYEFKDSYGDYKLICNSAGCLVIDEAGMTLTKSYLSEKASLMDGFLVDFSDDKAMLLKLN